MPSQKTVLLSHDFLVRTLREHCPAMIVLEHCHSQHAVGHAKGWEARCARPRGQGLTVREKMLFLGGGGMTTAAVTSRICRMREPNTPAPTFMAALCPARAAVSALSSSSIGWISLQPRHSCVSCFLPACPPLTTTCRLQGCCRDM